MGLNDRSEPSRETRPLYRLWVNDDHTVAIRLWEDDTLEVLTRESSDYDWGKPTVLREEKVA